MNAKELVSQYIAVIYDSYQAHVLENNDYETFGHEMAIVLPTFMKITKDLSDTKEITLEGAKLGEKEST